MAEAVQRQLKVLVQPQDGGSHKTAGYSARDFQYDAAAGTVTCPQNQRLDYGGEARQKGQQVKRYRCHVKDCPVTRLCKDSKGRRVVEIWGHTAAVQQMRQRLKPIEAQETLSKRGQIIERHFGHIKQHDGFRRWTVRGVDKVRTQWALINLSINLRLLHKRWSERKHNLN